MSNQLSNLNVMGSNFAKKTDVKNGMYKIEKDV
jgi:hypothetical protein